MNKMPRLFFSGEDFVSVEAPALEGPVAKSCWPICESCQSHQRPALDDWKVSTAAAEQYAEQILLIHIGDLHVM